MFQLYSSIDLLLHSTFTRRRRFLIGSGAVVVLDWNRRGAAVVLKWKRRVAALVLDWNRRGAAVV
jgi:hypothetical protein